VDIGRILAAYATFMFSCCTRWLKNQKINSHWKVNHNVTSVKQAAIPQQQRVQHHVNYVTLVIINHTLLKQAALHVLGIHL
jgi:hypothetical protein